MHLLDLDYQYAPELIAQEPLLDRAASRLLMYDRTTKQIAHHRFLQLPTLLRSGDLLIINDSRVRPARLIATRPSGGRAEVLLLHPIATEHGGSCWKALATRLKKLEPGTTLRFGADLSGVVDSRTHDGLTITFSRSQAEIETIVEQIGEPPLPPYIKRAAIAEDRERYQTVYASETGSAAAPTAGLHFTPEVLQSCHAAGIHTAPVTLHVGLDTFQPIRSANPFDHPMHGEYFDIPRTTLDRIAQTRAMGGRVIAVGTTTVRALESAAALHRLNGSTQMFIYPGFRFRWTDGMITNFHQPRTTLLLMVSAFIGSHHQLFAAYQEAITRKYRLFSYGDAMIVV
jgi:S-adenosylmethionine:tRNA ribosyltransferase-isomerase